ncbi:MAG TPA: Rieske 2Fe-2S domain-containing protein [Solirubrobacteraceae bacterium]|nr:Rieske 2Fe-2S domain-containing protein [Solirubrobacteraceae bacterium]
MNERLTRTPLEPAIRRLESLEQLDALGKRIGQMVRSSLPGEVKDILSGTWLGHAVHPMLTDVVIGSFSSASLLDITAGERAGVARQRLVGLGLLAYLPTAAAGVNDWADSEPVDAAVRRVGLVHAGGNAVAAWLYGLSWWAHRRGARRGAAGLALAGLGVLMTGGYLGGHLSLTKGVGPDQTVFDPGPTDWTVAADASQLVDGRPLRAIVGDTPVLLVRDGERVYAVHDRCSHRGCSLSEGTIQDSHVVCACHGSRFDLRDGAVKHGPATGPQPAFQVRLNDDRVEIRRLTPIG